MKPSLTDCYLKSACQFIYSRDIFSTASRPNNVSWGKPAPPQHRRRSDVVSLQWILPLPLSGCLKSTAVCHCRDKFWSQCSVARDSWSRDNGNDPHPTPPHPPFMLLLLLSADLTTLRRKTGGKRLMETERSAVPWDVAVLHTSFQRADGDKEERGKIEMGTDRGGVRGYERRGWLKEEKRKQCGRD